MTCCSHLFRLSIVSNLFSVVRPFILRVKVYDNIKYFVSLFLQPREKQTHCHNVFTRELPLWIYVVTLSCFCCINHIEKSNLLMICINVRRMSYKAKHNSEIRQLTFLSPKIASTSRISPFIANVDPPTKVSSPLKVLSTLYSNSPMSVFCVPSLPV